MIAVAPTAATPRMIGVARHHRIVLRLLVGPASSIARAGGVEEGYEAYNVGSSEAVLEYYALYLL